MPAVRRDRSDRLYRWNFAFLVLDSGGYSFAVSFISYVTIVPYYLSQLSNSSLLIALAPALFVLGQNLPSVITANYVRPLHNRKGFIVGVAVAERLFLALLVLCAWAVLRYPQAGLVGFLIAYGLLAITMGSITPAYVDFQARAIRHHRGIFFGVNYFVGAVLGSLGGVVVRYILGERPGVDGFLTVFAIGLAVSCVTILFTASIREPGDAVVRDRLPWGEYFGHLGRELRENTPFARFMLVRTALNLAEMATPFLTVYAASRFHLPASYVGLFAISVVVGQSVANLGWGLLGDRLGYKAVLLGAATLGILVLFLALSATGPSLFFLVFGLSGAVLSGNLIGNVNMVIEYSPVGETPIYSGLFNGIQAPSVALAPLLAGLLLRWWEYHQLFLVGLALYVVGFAAMALTPDPRHRRASLPEAESLATGSDGVD